MGAERTLCVLLKSTSCICLSVSLSFFLLLHSQKDLKVTDLRLSPFNEASSLCHSVHLTIIKPPFPGSSWPAPGHIPECPRDGLLKMPGGATMLPGSHSELFQGVRLHWVGAKSVEYRTSLLPSELSPQFTNFPAILPWVRVHYTSKGVPPPPGQCRRKAVTVEGFCPQGPRVLSETFSILHEYPPPNSPLDCLWEWNTTHPIHLNINRSTIKPVDWPRLMKQESICLSKKNKVSYLACFSP